MPLNYSKWDQLELSDDSDIEGHPNVDKRSLIRWKQRDIHEKREARKQCIAQLQAQIDCNNVLLPRITDIASTLHNPSGSQPPLAYFNGLVEKLTRDPSRDCPPGNDPAETEQTYDGMLLSLLQSVSQKAMEKVKEPGVLGQEKDERLVKELAVEMSMHMKQLGENIENDRKTLLEEQAEQKKHITSEDIHEGFESKYVPAKSDPEPLSTKTKQKKVTEIEVLNPQAGSSSSQTDAGPSGGDDEEAAGGEEEEGLPELTPSLEAFSKLPLRGYEKSFEFIQAHRDVVVPGAADGLLVAAFQAESDGKSRYAKQCIHQSLLLQYCEKLGGDGVRVFFKKMMSGDKRAEKVFVDDFENTYKHLVERVKISRAEVPQKEQIQLVPENPNQSILFNVPDGPPPENLVLEGPGTEDLDVEEVRKALQHRWEIFEAFPEDLQEALKAGGLDGVNKVLGEMDVPTAEAVVQNLDMAGILNFAEGGIRDQTGESPGEDEKTETV